MQYGWGPIRATCSVVVMLLGCEAASGATTAPSRDAVVAVQGMTPEETARFQAGTEEFSEAETVAEGLGPLFNAASCAQCHNSPSAGGSGLLRVVRAMCKGQDGALSEPPGGSLIHLFSTRPDVRSSHPPDDCDVVLAQRRTTTLMGAGLIEAIADGEIEAVAARQPAAQAGRAAVVVDKITGLPRVGRFGWKAQHATLDSFAGDAYLNELGITNEFFPEEIAPGGDSDALSRMDFVPDPEAKVGGVAQLADFMRFLAPPEAFDDEAGSALFAKVGCETCHRASYLTESGHGSLSGREVRLYSDLLLHDVGTGDGVTQGAAAANELRTPPLWGVRHAAVWLHDGRAASMDEAIRLHGRQAAGARDAYLALDAASREALLDFLRSL